MPIRGNEQLFALYDRQYSEAAYQEESGLAPEELRTACEEIFSAFADQSAMRRRSEAIAFLLKNARVEVHAHCPFAGRLECDDIMGREYQRTVQSVVKESLASELTGGEMRPSKLYTACIDLSHTFPDWQRLFTLGFPGILTELKERRQAEDLDEDQKDFLDGCIRVMDALLVYLNRLADASERISRGNGDIPEKTASCLRAISLRAPETTQEAMQMVWTAYYLQTKLDGTIVRSLGMTDQWLLPFWQTDRAAGKLTEEEWDELLRAFLLTIRAFHHPNNIPFALCGTDAQGNALYSELTLRILKVYDELDIFDPKLQIRWHRDLPENIVEKVLDMIRRGHNSLVILSDEVVISSLCRLGISHSDASAYLPVGCYEPTAQKELSRTTAGRISLPKAVELAISGGVDTMRGVRCVPEFPEPADFDAFLKAYFRILAEAVQGCMRDICVYERADRAAHPSPLYSSFWKCCIDKAKDAYQGGMTYNNSSINVFGLATAVDSLMAVKKLVYEEKFLSLRELAQILQSDWEGQEMLCLRCLRYPKYGNGDPECDALTEEIVRRMGEWINGAENERGGVFRMGMFSIDWYTEFGRKTGATPDGRRKGENLSKNMSAAVGRDAKGVTALLRSASSLDYHQVPNGTALDLMLHSSAVRGPEGMVAMRGLVKAFFARGGMALQINVLHAGELRRAQEDPASYRNLQVRLCGWNVRFADLSREVQDEFIRMSEAGGT